MCDTFVVLPGSTMDGSLLFGKNSDRDPNEAHEVIRVPRQNFPAGSRLKCTYIEIPQVEQTNAVLLMKPFWIWGAEMGANEHGVVIGNEAVFTKEPAGKEPGLIGMDFLRLGLERSSTAEGAVETIVRLLEQYGQSGNCGFAHPMFYHNSFLVADPQSAWVLETSGREWAAEKVRGTRSISNVITIGDRWDRASSNLVQHAVRRGWSKSPADFDFSQSYSDFLYTTFGAGRERYACTTALLNEKAGKITLQDAFGILRSHGVANDENWRPDASLTGADVCMHAGFGPIRISQSVGSLVAHLTPELHTFWVTATSAPCTSLFKPLWLDREIPWQMEPAPTGVFDPACLWWRHELIHRQVLHKYRQSMGVIATDQMRLEAEFIHMAGQASNDATEMKEIAERCYKMAEEAERSWLHEVSLIDEKASRFYYQMAWNDFNRKARFPLHALSENIS